MYQWKGGGYKKGYRKMNIVEHHVLMYVKGKMRPVETIQEMERGSRGKDGEGEFNYDVLLKVL
jgi:hypothetical protein